MDTYHALKLIAQFNCARNERAITTLLRALTVQMGFDYFRLYLISPSTIQRPDVRIFNGCPSEWVARYAQQGLFVTDPVVRKGIVQTMPILWACVIRECCDQQDEVGLGVMLQARDAGLVDGI
ncbi:MAG: autoinducer binding domain-containing protein, partial [Shewanella sp.]